jgi:hypothetical protein
MSVINLSADLSDPLLAVLLKDRHCVDAVEVGPWFSVEQICAVRQLLPWLPFHFHAADLIEEESIQLINAILDCTGSPWVSVHISVCEPGEVERIKMGQQVSLPGPEEGATKFIRKVKQLAASLPVPVIIENVEPLEADGCDYWARPEFICHVLDKTGCDILLDTAHAMIAAERFGMDTWNYLLQLPLEKVVQVHVSGPRQIGGTLKDVHQSMREVDEILLDSILSRIRPQVVTLEYIHEEATLRDQLARLKALLTWVDR